MSATNTRLADPRPGSSFKATALSRRKAAQNNGVLLNDLPTIEQSLTQELKSLLSRRSVSPRRLAAPGPNRSEIDLMLQVALRGPDHAGLRPWYVIEFSDEQREALADIFEQEKLRRDPLAVTEDRQRARDHAMRPPTLLAFVVSPLAHSRVPAREQWLAAGAALGNLLNAAHVLGYGAMVLSGERCFDSVLSDQIGVAKHEFLAGFVSVGRIREVPPAAVPLPVNTVRRDWTPFSERSA
jgi:nitroreductase